jgi:hypothetical protein
VRKGGGMVGSLYDSVRSKEDTDTLSLNSNYMAELGIGGRGRKQNKGSTARITQERKH